MRVIQLTMGKEAIVDDEDYEGLIKFSWQAKLNRSGNWYAKRGVNPSKSSGVRKYRLIMMHQQILGIYDGIDHIDGDGLNNRRGNLRGADQSVNNQNKRKKPGASSRFIGVSWKPRCHKWYAQIKVPKGPVQYLGVFEDEVEAAKAYDVAARSLYNGYVKTNFSHVGGVL